MLIFIANVGALGEEELFNRGYDLVPGYRKNKIDKFKNKNNKQQSLCAGLLLNYAVQMWERRSLLGKAQEDIELCEVDIKNAILGYDKTFDYEISLGADGKPFFVGKEMFFNLSHSEKYAVCAVSDRAVGIDVEGGRRVNLDIANRYFRPSELDWIMAGEESDRQDRFFRLWCLREAYGKAHGAGVFKLMDNMEFRMKEDPQMAPDCLVDGVLQAVNIYEFKRENYQIAVINIL